MPKHPRQKPSAPLVTGTTAKPLYGPRLHWPAVCAALLFEAHQPVRKLKWALCLLYGFVDLMLVAFALQIVAHGPTAEVKRAVYQRRPWLSSEHPSDQQSEGDYEDRYGQRAFPHVREL